MKILFSALHYTKKYRLLKIVFYQETATVIIKKNYVRHLRKGRKGCEFLAPSQKKPSSSNLKVKP
jgi:hypothetical protein